MKFFTKIAAATCAVLMCTTMNAQDKWSLERCISHAQEHNLQVKQQQLAVEQARNNLLAAKLGYAPSVNASMNHSMSWGRSVNLNDLEIIENKRSQSTSLNLSASLPLFEGMKKQNTVKSNLKQLEIAGTNVEKLKDEISLSVARGYLQVLLAYEIEKSAIESYNSVKEQVDRCSTLVQAGSQPYSSQLELEAQLANEKVQVVSARNNVKSALLTLTQLLDIEDIENFDIQIPETEHLALLPAENSIEEIYADAQDLPSVKGAELSLEQSRIQYKIQRGAALPTISFSAGYGTYFSDSQQSPFFEQFNNNRNPSLGFGLSIPIFNNWRSNTSIRNARLNIKQSELDLEITRQNLLKEIQQAANDADACYEKMNAAKQNMASARESFRYTQEKFNAGAVGGTDYTVAKANLFKAESDFLQNKYQYIFQQKVLDYYKNIPITL